MPEGSIFERVTLDSSVLLGPKEPEFLAGADLGYYSGYWSSWIVAEFARVRTEWITLRAVRELANRAEAERRLERSRARVNAAIRRTLQDPNPGGLPGGPRGRRVMAFRSG